MALSVAVLFARRPDQFLHPYLWVEEVRYVMPYYADAGWRAAIISLGGYLLWASTFLDVLAFQISIAWAPEIAAALALAFNCAVALAVALSPTLLRWPFACAFAVLLVPSDPEVFGVSLYAFWWAGVFLLVAALWNGGAQWLRWLYLIVGGLSSPVIVPVAAVLGLRAAIERTGHEIAAAGVAFALAAVQAAVMVSWMLTAGSPAQPSIAAGAVAVQFLGAFFGDGIAAGLVILAALGALAIFLRHRLGYGFVLLVALAALVVATVTVRLAPEQMAAMTPSHYGPRYFFYPFILLGWIMIQVAAVGPGMVRAMIGAAFALALAVATPSLSRRHDTIDWRAQLAACAGSQTYELPAHYIGSAADVWHVKMTGAQCRALIARSWL